jgi:hypothetical protein
MKKRGQKEQSVAKYLGFLIELKKAIELHPTMTTSPLVKKHRVDFATVTILKKTGTLVWVKGKGWEWRGSYPNAEMVYKIYVLKSNQKHNRRERLKRESKMTQEELPFFKRTRSVLPIGKKQVLPIEKPNPETPEQWRQRMMDEAKHKKPDQTAIPIKMKHETRQEYKDLINSKEKPYKVVTIPTPEPEKKPWTLTIFGITIIKINR